MASRSAQPDDTFPTKQIVVLALCRLAEPIAFTSIMAYTYVMVQELNGGDEKNASFYSGLLISAFAAAEALTAMFWGTMSDHYGRKPIILIGLAGTALSSLIFGFAKSFWVAFAARVLGGLLNGNIAVMQTMIAEMVKKPEHEPKAYAVNPFMWSLGTIIGAALGGFLAQPAHYYPNIFPEEGIFGKFPYLLPNLVAAIAIVLAITQGYFLMEETNPRFKNEAGIDDSAVDDTDSIPDELTPLRNRRMSAVDAYAIGKRRPSIIVGSTPTICEPGLNLRTASMSTVHQIEIISKNQRAQFLERRLVPPPKAFNNSVIKLIIAVVVMCYHQIGFASLLPVFLLDQPSQSKGFDPKGGLGYSVHDVGMFMSVNGVAAMIIQIFIFPTFVEKVGVRNSVVLMTILYPTSYTLMPLLTLLPESATSTGVYAVLLLQNLFSIIYYPCVLILLKNATTSSLVLGKVNGLAMSATSGARMIGPPLVGIIYGAAGSAAAWWSCSAVALAAIVQLYWLPDDKIDKIVIENPLRKKSLAGVSVVHVEEV